METGKKYKDTVFHSMMSEKASLVELHKWLTGEVISEDEIRITTLDGLIFDKFKNDVSYLAREVWASTRSTRARQTRICPLGISST